MPNRPTEHQVHSERTEHLVAELLALPFMHENVFHSVRFMDNAIEKEVCDVLLVHRDECIVFSVKAQNRERDLARTERWLKKSGSGALSQLAGAYRTLKERHVWCDHPRLGRKSFLPGTARPVHGVALLESQFSTTVDIDRTRMERIATVAPVTLMTVVDFANVAKFLRTWRDLRAYLDARHSALRDPDRRFIGYERQLFKYYTANRDSFSACSGIADAAIATASQTDALSMRAREQALASILEDFISHIAVSHDVDLPAEAEDLREHATPVEHGRAVLRDDLCDLTIQERAALGEQIGVLSGRAAEEQGADPFYGAVRFNRRPDKVYLVVVGWNLPPPDIAIIAFDATIAACVFYGKTVGVTLVANQVGNDVRFTLARFENVQSSPEMEQAGIELFGHVRPRRVEEAR